MEDGRLFQAGISPEPEYSGGVFTIDELYNDFLDAYPRADEKISRFLSKLKEQPYSDKDRTNITKAVKIATVAYQFNHNTEQRFRKETGPDGQPVPTLYHSLEMADRLVSEGNGMNWVAVTAMLFHDIPEDVRLVIVENNEEETIEGDAWFDVFRNEFRSSGREELLVDLIKGVTEKPLPDDIMKEGNRLRKRLAATPMYMLIEHFMKGGGQTDSKTQIQLSREEQKDVYEVVYNLEHIFNSAFKSPEHLQILLLKVTDIWHNSLSSRFISRKKILRIRLAAGIAERMGWYPMRSDLVFNQGQITDAVSPYMAEKHSFRFPSPGMYDDTDEFQDKGAAIADFINDSGEMHMDNMFIEAGWPFTHTDSRKSHWMSTTLPTPEIIIHTDRESIKSVAARIPVGKRYRFLNFPTENTAKGKTTLNLEHLNRFTVNMAEDFGRMRVDLESQIQNGKKFNLRLESGEPYLIDIFRNNSGLNLIHIPEFRGLFRGDLKESTHWETHLTSLIGFLYEPGSVGIFGNRAFVVSHQGSLFFLDGETEVGEVAKIIKKDPDGLRITDYRGLGFDAVTETMHLEDLDPKLKNRRSVARRFFYFE